ncbi:MAG TPA: SHOCT domain-containing protein [Chitinophagaceae bacterium]|nr:SHOCT domain-containing protein [Chitinophagaceae bacterium]
MNFQTLNKQRKFILIASVLGIISVFLPWVSISVFGMSQSVNGFQGWGVVVFILFIVSLFVSLMGNQTEPLEGTNRLAAVACGIIILFSTIMGIKGSKTSLDGGLGLVDANAGIGFILALISGLALVLFSLIFKKSNDSLKKSIEGLKKSISIPAVSAATNNEPAKKDGNDKIAQLERLTKLKESGNISEEEFQQLKSKLVD